MSQKKPYNISEKISFHTTENNTGEVPKYGHRHIQMLILFVVLTVAYCTRTSLYVAIVAMTDSTSSKNKNIPTFDWNNSSVILSSFFWGYVTLQVYGAYLIKKYGCKYFLLCGLTINSLVFCLIPLVAVHFGSIGVIVCRVVQGVSQGWLLPTANTVLGVWVPENERSRLGTFALSGLGLGALLGQLIAGYICASWLGWPGVFYVFGGLSIFSVVLWSCFFHNDPGSHPSISRVERRYIESSLKVAEDVETSKVPWSNILVSMPFWAILICTTGTTWCNQTMLTETPTYLNKVLGFDVSSSGFLSSGPSIFGWFAVLMFGHVADWLLEKNYMSTVAVRRLFQLLGTVPVVLSITLLGLIPTGHNGICVALLFLNAIFQGAIVCGYGLNIVDLSPRYSGIMQAIGNTTGAAVTILAPLYVQLVVPDTTDRIQWRQIFITAAVVNMGATIFYVIFASGDRQSWDGEKLDVEIEQANGKTGVHKISIQEKIRKISTISAMEMQIM